jgi:1-deoxy-D-xylulose-5-phosphate synthase
MSRLIKEVMYPDYVKQLKPEELHEFCDEIRSKLIEIISQTGGHIGVNLGVVELTVALYRVFDFPKDSLIWDIGHQIYIQKMLTGRLDKLREIRKNGGSPGYAFSDESDYERVTSSHAGASFSLALGVALANAMDQNPAMSVAVIGDGAFVEGSTQEALNHLAVEKCKMLIVLNDNEMALDNNYGGLHEYFKSRQIGESAEESYFSSLGIPYEGPINGHDVQALVEKLTDLKDRITEPTVLHIKTVKGKGLEKMADSSPVRIHWNFPFDPDSGKNTEFPKAKSYAAFQGAAIMEIMEQNPEAVLISPATLQNTGTFNVFHAFPDRSHDVSLAEQHSMTLAGGFALEGKKPILCFESTFMQRVFDQLIHDICINNLPILIVSARSGHTGLDHLTHHSLLDISYMRSVPNLKIVYPATTSGFFEGIKEEYNSLKQPTVVLSPYGNMLDDCDPGMNIDTDDGFDGKSDAKGIVLSVGPQNMNAMKLVEKLAVSGVKFDHLAITQIQPLSKNIRSVLCEYDYVVTMEEGLLPGGFGSLILEELHEMGSTIKLIRAGFAKEFVEHGTRDYIYESRGIDFKSVATRMSKTWPELFGS